VIVAAERIFLFQYKSRQSFVRDLVEDALDAGVGPLSGLSEKEKDLVLAYADTLPRAREAPRDLLGDLESEAGVCNFKLSLLM